MSSSSTQSPVDKYHLKLPTLDKILVDYFGHSTTSTTKHPIRMQFFPKDKLWERDYETIRLGPTELVKNQDEQDGDTSSAQISVTGAIWFWAGDLQIESTEFAKYNKEAIVHDVKLLHYSGYTHAATFTPSVDGIKALTSSLRTNTSEGNISVESTELGYPWDFISKAENSQWIGGTLTLTKEQTGNVMRNSVPFEDVVLPAELAVRLYKTSTGA